MHLARHRPQIIVFLGPPVTLTRLRRAKLQSFLCWQRVKCSFVFHIGGKRHPVPPLADPSSKYFPQPFKCTINMSIFDARYNNRSPHIVIVLLNIGALSHPRLSNSESRYLQRICYQKHGHHGCTSSRRSCHTSQMAWTRTIHPDIKT